MKSKFLILFLLVSWNTSAQQAYELEQVLSISRGESYQAATAKTQTQIAEQSYNLFKARLKPSLNLEGQLPGYFQSSTDITQPNGTIEFQRVAQNNSSLSLFTSQEIAATGGRLFLQSDLRRFDDFTFNNKLYNGVPLRIGIIQPIFGFNSLKWLKKTAPLELQEAVKQYNSDIENTQVQTVFFYSQILVASENLKIAKLNTEVNEKLLNIAKERLNLGKISQDEKLQLEIELDNAKVNLQQSEYDLNAAEQNLWTYLGQKSNNKAEYNIPAPMESLMIDPAVAINSAMKNRPEIIAFERRILEATQNISQVKAQTGPQANLYASFGLARGSQNLEEVYGQPFTESQVSLTFSVPILDWGNRKSSVKRAQLTRDDELARIEQEKAELENAVRLKVKEFLMIQNAVQAQEDIRTLAEKRFEIANERYILGAISITDWTLAQREKDQTRRNYIQTLSNYWQTYYELRFLTGYDFKNNQKITY